MIDTLMVLWTRGACGRFLRALVVFLLLFTAICVLLFLVTASGVKWPGLAVTVSSPGASSISTAAQPTPTATPSAYSVPIILQNPTAIPVIPTPTAASAPTPIVTHTNQQNARRNSRHPLKTPIPVASGTPPAPDLTPTPAFTPQPVSTPTSTP